MAGLSYGNVSFGRCSPLGMGVVVVVQAGLHCVREEGWPHGHRSLSQAGVLLSNHLL